MEMFLIYYGITILMMVGAWIAFSKEITLKEFFTNLGIQTIVIAIICFTVYTTGLSDTETLNSSVVSKDRREVSCEHSYSCPPCYTTCSGSGRNKTCSTHCSTCYEHDYDVDWVVKDSISLFEIDRIDRQGLNEPPRWTSVYTGEPTSHHHTYDNYLKADPDSLFKQTMSDEEAKKYPDYPGEIYDYYRSNRLVTLVNVDKNQWNKRLSEINSEVGPAKQANLVVVLVSGRDNKYAYSLQRAWKGAKKNDVVVVINTSDGATISWTETIGISHADFKVKMRAAVMDYQKFDIGVLEVIKDSILKDFKRKPMKEYEYLKESFKPSAFAFWIGFIICILLNISLTWFAIKEDYYRRF